MEMILSLEGVWVPRPATDDPIAGSSHESFYEDLYASHFSGNENAVLNITASTLDENTMSFSYSSKRSCTTREYFLDHFNIFFPSGTSSSSGTTSSCCTSTIFGSVIALDVPAGSCSLLAIGPLAGQRVIEKYALLEEGMVLNVRFFISSIEGDYQITRIYDRRSSCEESSVDPDKQSDISECNEILPHISDFCQFPTSHPSNNWKRVKSHNSSTLQALQIEMSVEKDVQAEHSPTSSPDSTYPSADSVIMYDVEVTLPAKDNQPIRTWNIKYRYSHFRVLWKFLVKEFDDIQDSTAKHLPDLPPFPPKWPFVKSESSLQYRCKGLQHFMCGIISQGAYEPYVGSRAANMVDLLSAFLEVPNHFLDVSQPPLGSADSAHCFRSVYNASPVTNETTSDDSAQQFVPSPKKSPHFLTKKSNVAAPVFVVVKGARNRKAPMFPHVSVFEWVPIVEYELFITRVEDNASLSVFRRYKDITSWFQNILDILSVSHSVDILKKLNLPARKSSGHINTFRTSSKTDVTGNYVKYRIAELQKSIQSLLTEFPMVVNLPLSQEFFEMHNFPPLSNFAQSLDNEDLAK